MNVITIKTPSGNLRLRRPSCIGQYYVILHDGNRYVGNAIDAKPNGHPKRIRIQYNPEHQGEVLKPNQYQIIEKIDTLED